MPFKLDPEMGDWKTRRENLANLFKALGGPVPGNVKIKDETTGIDGNKILLRWCEREGTAKGGPAVLYLHGGGYIAGTVPLTDAGVAAYVTSRRPACLSYLSSTGWRLRLSTLETSRLAVMGESLVVDWLLHLRTTTWKTKVKRLRNRS